LQEHKGKEELTTSLLGDSRHPPKPPEREGVVHNNAPTGKLLQKKLLRTDLESHWENEVWQFHRNNP
jgi:hypothetical protein